MSTEYFLKMPVVSFSVVASLRACSFGFLSKLLELLETKIV